MKKLDVDAEYVMMSWSFLGSNWVFHVFPKIVGFFPQNGWWKSWFQTLWTNGWFGGFPMIFGLTPKFKSQMTKATPFNLPISGCDEYLDIKKRAHFRWALKKYIQILLNEQPVSVVFGFIPGSYILFHPMEKDKTTCFFKHLSATTSHWTSNQNLSDSFFHLNLGVSGPKLSKTVMPFKRLQVLQEELGDQGHRLSHHLQIVLKVSKELRLTSKIWGKNLFHESILYKSHCISKNNIP